MRILYLVQWVDIPTGALMEHVAAQPGVYAELLTERDDSPCELSDRLHVSKFRSRGKLDFAAARELRTRIVAGRFDVVHAMSSRYLANAMVATRGMQDAPAICGFMGHVAKFSRWNAIQRLTYLHSRLAGVWCNCRAVAEPLFRAGVPRDKLFPIYSGYPCRERSTTPDPSVHRELGLPADAVVVGFAGNMRPVKGVDVLLEAAIRLRDEPSIHWLLLGRVEDRRVERLLKRPELDGRVHALGWRSDAERLLPAMDIFAMPSRTEGFSRAITEAMEMGICPVATRVGGTPELVRDGVDGLLVAKNDVGALTEAIRTLVRNPALRKSLAASARERIRTELTTRAMGEQAAAMYAQILGPSRQLSAA